MNIVFFLLDTVFFFLVFLALLRAWLNAARISMSQQPGLFIMAATDWLVMPLRRSMPMSWQRSRWDTASVLAACLLALLHGAAIALLGGWQAGVMAWLSFAIPVLAFKFLVKAMLQGTFMLVLLYAVLSWVQPHSPVQAWLVRLLGPLLAPLRKVIPLIGGVDLSPLALVVLLQVGLMVVG